MAPDTIKETSAGAILYRVRQNRPLFLLLRYTEGHWGFPKGHMEQGEEPLETARRETHEETGISELDFLDSFQERISYTYVRDENAYTKTVHFFIAKTSEQHVQLSEEHTDYAWLIFEDALNRITYDEEKWLLRKAAQQIWKTY